MNKSKYRSIIIYIVPILMSLYPTFASPEASQKGGLKDDKAGPIVIKSKTFEIDNKKLIVTFSGDVDARRDDLIINCGKMLIHYRNMSGGQDPDNVRASIDRIIATEKVKISRPDGGSAIAEKAIYYHDDEKIVLTGKPVVKQGNDFVEGSKITLFLQENRSIVEGSEDGRARAVLFPKKK
ncbi:lipopolysaccharide transport periplasmic protein LptA [Thermodesulfobacteriota bacterium]